MSNINLHRFNNMFTRWTVRDKALKVLTVTLHSEVTDDDEAAVKLICEDHGWKHIVIATDIKPCGGVSFTADYINPEDTPKQEPGHVYA